MSARLAVIAAMVFVAVLVVGWLGRESAERSRFTSRLSTWSAAPEGGRALYTLVERLGAKPERVTHNLEVIPEQGVMVSVQPQAPDVFFLLALFGGLQTFTDEEVEAIQAWVAQGNTFVLVSNDELDLPRAFGLEMQWSGGAPDAVGFWDALKGAIPDEQGEPEESEEQGEPQASDKGRRGRGTKPIKAQGWSEWPPKTEEGRVAFGQQPRLAGVGALKIETSAPGVALDEAWLGLDADEAQDKLEDGDGFAELLVGADGRAVGAEVRRGGGRFVFVGSSYMATNGGLGEADNALALVRLMGVAQGERVYFDEFHHGFSHERSLSGYLRDSGLWVLVAQLAVLLGLVGWRLQERFGPSLALFEEEWRGAGDQLKAMSQIYARGGHAKHALGVLLDDLERALVERHRLPRGSAGEELAQALGRQGLGEDAARLRALRARVAGVGERERGKQEAQVLSLGQEIARWAQALRS
jgi:hypothetical protein